MPLHVNLKKNVWYCHATKRGGNQLDLVALLEQVSIREATDRVVAWFDLQGVQTEAPARKPGWNVPLGGAVSDDLEDGTCLYPKQFRPELELYNLSVVGEFESDNPVVVLHPHEVWEQHELGCPRVVATMLPGLSVQQKKLLGAR